jgi:HPt (histidine-containing phosphotransfer) domain-containing protein
VPPAVDQDAFAALRELTGDDPVFLAELIDAYLADAPEQLTAARAAVDAADVEALVRPAHTLKGNSANVGAMALAEQCRALEELGRSGSLDGAGAGLDEAAAEYERVREELLALRGAS